MHKTITGDTFSGGWMRYALLPIVALLISAGSVFAQDTEPQEESHEHPGFYVGDKYYTCGTAWASDYDYDAAVERTRRNNPEVYQRMVELQKFRQAPELQGADDLVWNFNITDRVNPENGYYTVTGALKYDGDSILIFVDVDDTSRVLASTIEKLAEGLTKNVKEGPNTRNANQGIVPNDIEIFGDPPVNRIFTDHITSFLLTDIKEPSALAGGIIEGYFNPFDQTERVGSNGMNILYIDDKEGLGNQSDGAIDDVIGTMAHEFQHLINHRQYGGEAGDVSTHWIYNEGLSEVASLRNGYRERYANQYLQNPNRYIYFSRPDGQSSAYDVLRAYERGMLWVHYISQQYNDELLKYLTQAGGQGLAPLDNAISMYNAVDGRAEQDKITRSAASIYAAFWVANFLLNTPNYSGDDRYLYWYTVATQTASYDSKGSVPDETESDEILLKGHAAYLPRYSNQDPDGTGAKVTFNEGSDDYAVHAVIFDETNSISVQEVPVGQETSFRDFKTLIFIVANLYGDGNNVSWSISPTTLGVEDFSSNETRLSLTQVSPMPASDHAFVSFSTAVTGAIDIQLIDMTGTIVSRPVRGARYELGEHTISLDTESVPSGTYLLQIRDAEGNLAVKQIQIAR